MKNTFVLPSFQYCLNVTHIYEKNKLYPALIEKFEEIDVICAVKNPRDCAKTKDVSL